MQKQNNKKNNDTITLILKLVGTACNMHCRYCYDHVSKTHHLGCNNISHIKDYLNKFIHYKHVFIVFHGGEPLLASYELMDDILNFIINSFKNIINIQIQTNGTLINEKWLSIFKKFQHKLSLSISLDPIGIEDLRFSDPSLRKNVVKNIKRCIGTVDNVGIISVAHALNLHAYSDFIEELIDIHITNLTITKCQTNILNNNFFINEQQYVNLLKSISINWINKQWYTKINIQPLLSLFSSRPNKLCVYLQDSKKCGKFRTFYNKDDHSHFCDHIVNGIITLPSNSCKNCNIYHKCGGGCLAITNQYDSTFCQARKELFNFIEDLKNGSKRSLCQ